MNFNFLSSGFVANWTEKLIKFYFARVLVFANTQPTVYMKIPKFSEELKSQFCLIFYYCLVCCYRREQVDRENITRRKYSEKHGYMVENDAPIYYNPNFINNQLERDETFSGECTEI